MKQQGPSVAAVVIGRNEGERLKRCLESLKGQAEQIVYVDSGSSDGSVALSREMGLGTVELTDDLPFTAARARNSGILWLHERGTPPTFVQFVDGDCEVRDGWIETAKNFLVDQPGAAVVCGRRRERFPEASVFNRLIDLEWDTPIGAARTCGGDALMRVKALSEVGYFNQDMIAGEEPELCIRLRSAGWSIWRIDEEMCWHDANIIRFGQWWRRARRAGHAYGEGAWLSRALPGRHNQIEVFRALFWGFAVPAAALVLAVANPLALLILMAWPAQIVRLGLRNGDWSDAFFLVVGKPAEALGVLEFAVRRVLQGRSHLIEYK